MASEYFTGGFQLERKTLNWKIVNFNDILTCDDLILRQKMEFQAGDSIGLPTKWSFYLKPESDPRSGKTWVGAFLRVLEKPEKAEDVYAQYTLQVSGSPKSFGTRIRNFVNEDSLRSSWGFGFHDFIDRKSDISKLPLRDGAIFIKLELTLYAPFKEVWDIQHEKYFESKSVEHFIQDLNENYFTLTAPDVHLISKDKVTIGSDRRMLSARSPFFRKMFQPDMSEQRILAVEIDDLSGLTLHVLNMYLCTGELDPDWKKITILEELIYAAKKFHLGHLYDFLDTILAKICTKQNVKTLAALAKKFGMNKAEQDLIEYMKKNATSLEDLMIVTGIEKEPVLDGVKKPAGHDEDGDGEPEKKRSNSSLF